MRSTLGTLGTWYTFKGTLTQTFAPILASCSDGLVSSLRDGGKLLGLTATWQQIIRPFLLLLFSLLSRTEKEETATHEEKHDEFEKRGRFISEDVADDRARFVPLILFNSSL